MPNGRYDRHRQHIISFPTFCLVVLECISKLNKNRFQIEEYSSEQTHNACYTSSMSQQQGHMANAENVVFLMVIVNKERGMMMTNRPTDTEEQKGQEEGDKILFDTLTPQQPLLPYLILDKNISAQSKIKNNLSQCR